MVVRKVTVSWLKIFVRDKDAVSACTLLAEICAWAKDQGKTLFEVLLDIYVEYGFSKETTVNVVKPGKSGAEEIKAMMENFRSNPPREIGGSKVVLVKDFKTLKATDGNGNITEIDMPELVTYCNILQKMELKFQFARQEQNLKSSSMWK